MESLPPYSKNFEEKEDKVNLDLSLPEKSKPDETVETPESRRNFWLKFSACFFATCFIWFFFLFYWKHKCVPHYFEPCFYKDKISENDMFHLYLEVEMLNNKTEAINYLLNISSVSPHLLEPLTQELKTTKADYTTSLLKYQKNRVQWKLCYDKNVMADNLVLNAAYFAFLNIYAVATTSLTMAAIYFYIKSGNEKLTVKQQEKASELYPSIMKYGFGHLISLLIIFGIKYNDSFDVGFNSVIPPIGTSEWHFSPLD